MTSIHNIKVYEVVVTLYYYFMVIIKAKKLLTYFTKDDLGRKFYRTFQI